MSTKPNKKPRFRTMKRLVEGAQKFVGNEPNHPQDEAGNDMLAAARRIDELRGGAQKKKP